MSRCMMIVNPTSGREKAKYYKDDLYAQLQTMFDEVNCVRRGVAGMPSTGRKKRLTIIMMPFFPWVETGL